MELFKSDNDQLKEWIQAQKAEWKEVNPSPTAKAKIWSQLGLESPDPTTTTSIVEFPKELKSQRKVKVYWLSAFSAAAVLLLIWGISAKLAVKDLEIDPQLVSMEDLPSTRPSSAGKTDNKITESVISESQIEDLKGLFHQTKEEKYLSNEDENQILPTFAESNLLEQIANASLASNRIEGIIALANLEHWSEQAVHQLLNTAKQDDNSNVRAAAIEVIMGRVPPQYHQVLIEEILAYQHDPMIQFELILRLNSADELTINAKTAEYLYAVAEDPFAFDFVREQAYAVLLKSL